ncbi:RNI-like protein [Dichomitus squalens LYAD-421 SS1]|uniref:RNI-like protein n=1 Tax=Dichomitus squalens (strain LYAD-421) TaxID=732165 RepID=R7SP63_DICSQ|nr:RNI-like protein [Dichomitus squalens LYAD-421 SS1]EJF57989.1 RNI-like protein [Dichomitus squalens LYAD-421 SS1]
MSRRNNAVRGPTSALTEFLRESGITPTTIARRVQTRAANEAQAAARPAAGPSNQAQQEDGDVVMEEAQSSLPVDGYASDNLDEPDEPAPKKRRQNKATEAKQKEKEKAKAKKRANKGDDDDYEDDGHEDPYSALSKMWKGDLPKPPIGSFEKCARCEKQFTVTKYTLAANPPPGWLCHICAKSSGADPFKKPAAPRKRKPAADKRNVVSYEERRFPSLASVCIDVISKHIDDVEALGDIGTMNVEEIARALAKNRRLTPENVMLFYDIENVRLTLYDATNLKSPALCALASLNPNLTHLRIEFCGHMDDAVINTWATSMPHLKRLELLGPFLVRPPAWQAFLEAHPGLEGFLIIQSPRFDIECVRVLVESCRNLKELRLQEIGQMSDAFLECIKPLGGQLIYLDLSKPGIGDAVSEKALISMLEAVGDALEYLDLSGHLNITDALLFRGLKPHVPNLSSLVLNNTPDLTDAGVAEFFDNWNAARLSRFSMRGNHGLADAAIGALLNHSGSELTHLDINGWKDLTEDGLKGIPAIATNLKRLDVGFCRAVDDFFVKSVLERCVDIEEIMVWACQRLTEHCPRKRNVKIEGLELSN